MAMPWFRNTSYHKPFSMIWSKTTFYAAFRTSNTEFRITNRCRDYWDQERAESEDRAKARLIPGTHGWSSIYEYYGHTKYGYYRHNDIDGHYFINVIGEHFIVPDDENMEPICLGKKA
jgi:hypothetical protein